VSEKNHSNVMSTTEDKIYPWVPVKGIVHQNWKHSQFTHP